MFKCMLYVISFVVFIVWLLRCVQLFAIPWPIERQAPLSSTTSQGLLTFMPTESMMLSNHLILCCPLLLLPSIFPSIRDFSNASALLIRWPKYCSFSMSPSNQYSALISFRIDWFDQQIDWFVPCCPRNTQESTPAPQFESINSDAL